MSVRLLFSNQTYFFSMSGSKTPVFVKDIEMAVELSTGFGKDKCVVLVSWRGDLTKSSECARYSKCRM
jgi:hypothetical protein